MTTFRERALRAKEVQTIRREAEESARMARRRAFLEDSMEKLVERARVAIVGTLGVPAADVEQPVSKAIIELLDRYGQRTGDHWRLEMVFEMDGVRILGRQTCNLFGEFVVHEPAWLIEVICPECLGSTSSDKYGNGSGAFPTLEQIGALIERHEEQHVCQEEEEEA